MTTGEALIDSRRAHLQGRQLARKGDRAGALAQFQIALDRRLEARKLDPDHIDPAWGDDLMSLHSRKEFDAALGLVLHRKEGDAAPAGYDLPSRLVAELGTRDAEIEAFFRHQLGDSNNIVSRVGVADAAARVHVPDQWAMVKPGQTICRSCQHGEAVHVADGCTQTVFGAFVGLEVCACLGYVKTPCLHAWATTAAQRQCRACGQVDELQHTMALEDTEAYKQLEKEAKP